jgi:hypothetical protein
MERGTSWRFVKPFLNPSDRKDSEQAAARGGGKHSAAGSDRVGPRSLRIGCPRPTPDYELPL